MFFQFDPQNNSTYFSNPFANFPEFRFGIGQQHYPVFTNKQQNFRSNQYRQRNYQQQRNSLRSERQYPEQTTGFNFQDIPEVINNLFFTENLLNFTPVFENLFNDDFSIHHHNPKSAHCSHSSQTPKYIKQKITPAQFIEKLECPICLTFFEYNIDYTALKCGHIFHDECVKPWVENHHSCPVCRADV
jgi:hypothetical protein